MSFLNRMEEAISYIEAHITEDFSISRIANIICCDSYQFGRIFSYVTGVSLGVYIRNRRLSLAAAELSAGGRKVIDVALKYGYNSPEAFARAFRALHGITPREAAAAGAQLRMFPRLSFALQVKGVVSMEYRIVEMGEINGVGVVKNFGQWTANREAKNWKDNMGEVWEFWEQFLDRGENIMIRDKYKLYRPPFWQMGVSSTDPDGNLTVCIGAEDAGGNYPELDHFAIPSATWGIFTAKGTLNQEAHPIGELQTRIFSEWMPSSGYEKSMNCQIEVYGPGDTNDTGYTCEIWIPVCKTAG